MSFFLDYDYFDSFIFLDAITLLPTRECNWNRIFATILRDWRKKKRSKNVVLENQIEKNENKRKKSIWLKLNNFPFWLLLGSRAFLEIKMQYDTV